MLQSHLQAVVTPLLQERVHCTVVVWYNILQRDAGKGLPLLIIKHSIDYQYLPVPLPSPQALLLDTHAA